LTQAASAFVLRPGAGGRLEAVPFQIPPAEAARDRGVLQRLFASHTIGRRKTIERLRLRRFNRPPPNNPQHPGRPQPPSRGQRPSAPPRRPKPPGQRQGQ
jgi:hypothetical protein